MRVDGESSGRSKSFEVLDMSPEAFVEAAGRAIETLNLAVKVFLALRGDQLVVTVERLGSSVLRYDLVPRGRGFTARLRSRRVAPLHLAFEREFRETVARLVERVAGESTSR